MKAIEVEEHLMINYITEQLHKKGYYKTKGKSKRQLSIALAIIKAQEIKPDNPGQGWF